MSIQQVFADGEVNIAELKPRQSQGSHSVLFIELDGNNCFSIITKVIF